VSIPLHILAADDEPDITAYLKEYLESLGHRVDTAANGIEALNNISSAHREQDAYQLLLIDARMPALDGVSLARELRRGKDFTDIAFITGDEALLPQLDAEAQRLGCLMVLNKPFDQAQLMQLIEFVGMRRGRRISSSGNSTLAISRNAAPAAAPSGLPPPPTTMMPPPAPLNPPSVADLPPLSLTPVPAVDEQPLEPSREDEYQPTSARAANASKDAVRNERRSQVFYPEPPSPGDVRTPLPGGPPSTRSFGTPLPLHDPVNTRPLTPLPRSQTPVQPIAYQPPSALPRGQAQPPGSARLAGPPVANPAAGQQLPRDPRYTSRIMQNDGIDQRLPPVPQPGGNGQTGTTNRDPRRTSRIAPIATPLPTANGTGTELVRKMPLVSPAADAIRAALQGPPPEARPRTASFNRQAPPQGQGGFAQGGTAAIPNTNDGTGQAGRLRRSVVGSVPPAQNREASRLVGCAHCGGTFTAPIRSAAYNLVCVHCGRLNRIDP
jgi:CheY-like chemotaxis protein